MDERRRPPLRAELLDGLDPASVTLADLCAQCVSVLASSGAALQLTADGVTAVTEASDGAAGRAADVQAMLGEGPTVDAIRLHRSVFTHDLAGDERWPELAPVSTVGYRAAIAVPLRVDSTVIGALTAYYHGPTSIDAAMLTHAAHVARVLTGILLTLPVWAPNALADAISVAAAHQGRIHQAAGIVSVDESCSLEEASVRLRAYAYAHDRQLADVAEAVVTRGLRLT
jgi:GAF domain-containing protein